MVDTFYSGTLGVVGPVVEWDGTNHADIVSWMNEISSPTWSVVTVTGTYFTINNGSMTRTMPIDTFIGRSVSGPPPVYLAAGRYKTSDPVGRAETIDDLVIP